MLNTPAASGVRGTDLPFRKPVYVTVPDYVYFARDIHEILIVERVCIESIYLAVSVDRSVALDLVVPEVIPDE